MRVVNNAHQSCTDLKECFRKKYDLGKFFIHEDQCDVSCPFFFNNEP